MRLSQETLIMLARSGDEQAIRTLRIVENETANSLLETVFIFKPEMGIFHASHLDSRRPTVVGMQAVSLQQLQQESSLVGPSADRT